MDAAGYFLPFFCGNISMSFSWTMIVNPTSGGGRGEAVGRRMAALLRARGVSVEVLQTRARGEVAALAGEALARGAHQIAICGGDGTVHEAINALIKADVLLGLVPCGRGNDLARALGVTGQVSSLADTLVYGTVRAIDLGRIGDRYFATVASLGFDTVVARAVYENRVPFSGALAYTLAVLTSLRGFACPHVVLAGDFGRYEGPIFVAATGNTAFYGGGIRVTPGAIADSGEFEVCLVPQLPKWRALRLFAKAFSGRHVDSPAVRVEKTRTLSVVSQEPLWIFADGEPICQTPATLSIAPKALRVQVPSGR